ncbi:MAG: MATE family efflux transporter [Actinobacteria bacterium]|nr:MATE family efflux transporter [Actinomycetota bacterium]
MNRIEQNISDLGSKRIGPLLAKLAIPTTIGMIANSLYNVVDTIFIGRGVGTLAIAGIGIVFPIQMIIMAIAQLFGMGAASMISRSLGKKDYDSASNIAGNSFVASFAFGTFAAIIIFIFLNPILRVFGATENILPFARDYLSVVTFGFIYFPFLVSSNNMVRAEGDAKNAMAVMLLSTGTNIILDPIFIFVLGLGIRGAAYATIIAQFSGFIYIILYYILGKSSLSIKFHHFKIRWLILKEMVSLGFASFVRQVSASILIIVVNNSLRVYGGDITIAVFSIVNKMVLFVTMPLFGIVAGSQPIIGFNYGANNMGRVKESFKTSALATVVIGAVFFTMFMVFPSNIINLFSTDTELINMGIFPLRMTVLLFPFIGFQIIGAGFFQSIGKARPSIVLSLSRQVLFLIPLVLLLPPMLGINGIWIAFPIADILAIMITGILIYREFRKINKLQIVLEAA